MQVKPQKLGRLMVALALAADVILSTPASAEMPEAIKPMAPPITALAPDTTVHEVSSSTTTAPAPVISSTTIATLTSTTVSVVEAAPTTIIASTLAPVVQKSKKSSSTTPSQSRGGISDQEMCVQKLRTYNSMPGGQGILQKMGYTKNARKRPCYLRVIHVIEELAPKHGRSVALEIGRGACESYLDPYEKGGSYDGLYQQYEKDFKKRLRIMSKMTGVSYSGSIYDPWLNAKLSFFMMQHPKVFGSVKSQWECDSALVMHQL
jgi:hypothetical protein